MDERLFRFFHWTDMHIRDLQVPGRSAGYPRCNDKATWAVGCARGECGMAPPDFIASTGDLICGEVEDYDVDFRFLDKHLLAPLGVPLLPCLGNHENRQGEGIPQHNAAYDRRYGPGWHNYLYIVGGIAFIVIDSTGAHRQADEVTAARNAFAQRALQRAGELPVLVLTHVPLIPMRDAAALLPSFGFSSWKILDETLLAIIEAHADQVIAVLCGHLHLTGVRQRQGIYHITPSGTAGYPADFAVYDVYADRLEVEMVRAPAAILGDRNLGDIHGARRHGIDYTDSEHPDHESYVSGTATERSFTIRLAEAKRPNPEASRAVVILHEDAGGGWRQVELPERPTTGPRPPVRVSPPAPSPLPQTPDQVMPMLSIGWSAGPPLPRGMQDNDGGILGKWLVVAGGFCGGYESDIAPRKYRRGFLRDTYALNLQDTTDGWRQLADFPGCARQEMVAAVAGDSLYLWGGFSYDAPCTFADGYRLSRLGTTWRWDPLPPLPYPLAAAAAVSLGSWIYVMGGTDYDGEAFYTAADRQGGCAGLGRQLWRISVDALAAGRGTWEACAPCPGTHRSNAAVVALADRIIVLGGIAVGGTPPTYCSVVDNWSYHPHTDSWTRLRDTPASCGGWPYGANLWRNRYVLLPAGYMYASVLGPDGDLRAPYGPSTQIEETWQRHPRLVDAGKYYNHVWVYDTREDLFGTATPLPYDDHTPPTFIVDDTAYLLANETGGFEYDGHYFGHHPEFVLQGSIRAIPS